jgi:hypothetical protein
MISLVLQLDNEVGIQAGMSDMRDILTNRTDLGGIILGMECFTTAETESCIPIPFLVEKAEVPGKDPLPSRQSDSNCHSVKGMLTVPNLQSRYFSLILLMCVGSFLQLCGSEIDHPKTFCLASSSAVGEVSDFSWIAPKY